MYPTLSDLLHDLFGLDIPLPIQTFGLFVAISFLTASFILKDELRRKERIGLLSPNINSVWTNHPFELSNIMVNLVAGFTIGLLLTALITIGIDKTRWINTFNNSDIFLYVVLKRHWIIIFVFAFAFLGSRYFVQGIKALLTPITEAKEVWPHERTDAILGIAAIGGLIGAKLFDAFENWDSYIAHPGNFLAFSGLTFYGGLIVAAAGIFMYAHNKKINLWHLADCAAPALMIGYGIGRIGCHLAGDGDWGIENLYSKPFGGFPNWLWSYTYPHNVSDQGIPIPNCKGPHCFQLLHGVFPTSLYEFLACTLLFLILWKLRTTITSPGLLFGVYLMMNGAERFLVELIRVNNKYDLGFIRPTQAELISLAILIVGLATIVVRKKVSH